MEERASQVRARLDTVASFGELVNAMRGIAAARAHRARMLIDGTNAYAATIAAAMRQARQMAGACQDEAQPRSVAPLWIVFCAEQGFSGGFSEQVLATVPEARGGRVMLLGTQGLRLSRSHGIEPCWSAPLIAHADAAVAVSERLQAALVGQLLQRAASPVNVVYAKLSGANHFVIASRRLLPLEIPSDGMQGAAAPYVHLSPASLLDMLAREHVAAVLTQAMLHSHAAENLARLQAMAAAHENVERMIKTLRADERMIRQEAITAEIVELAAGLRGLRGRSDGKATGNQTFS